MSTLPQIYKDAIDYLRMNSKPPKNYEPDLRYTAISYGKFVEITKLLKDISIKPKRIRTEVEARNANLLDERLGMKGGWKVGDEYYEAKAVLGNA
jgi:hypothetical protein